MSAAGVTVPESDWKQHEAHRGWRILRLQLAVASGGLQVVVCLQGLLPSLVAGRPNTSEPRVVAGVHGCKFTVVPVPVSDTHAVATIILASDHVTCGVPIVQHTACEYTQSSPGPTNDPT